jgi:hypothetical protein
LGDRFRIEEQKSAAAAASAVRDPKRPSRGERVLPFVRKTQTATMCFVSLVYAACREGPEHWIWR